MVFKSSPGDDNVQEELRITYLSEQSLMKGLLTEIWQELRNRKWDAGALREQQEREGVSLPGLRGQGANSVAASVEEGPSGGV